MNQTVSAVPGPLPQRHRHRSPARKLIESLALFVGVPLLLFAVLALAVDVIEYRPSRSPAASPPALHGPTATPALD